MTPPRWNSPYAASVRDELVHMVEGEQSAAATIRRPERAGRKDHLRLALAIVIAMAVVVPATFLAVSRHSTTDVAGGGRLSVATGELGVYQADQLYTELTGTLEATRSGPNACFFIDDRLSGGAGARTYFVFPKGYAATSALDLLDASGKVVAGKGDSVAVATDAAGLALVGTAEGCPEGHAVGALHVARGEWTADAPTAVARPSIGPSKGPVTAGCRPTSATTPRGAFTAEVADVDGDGKRDTEWAVQVGGTLQFGITTASGATISGKQGFAGGGDRSFVVGRLANGVVVAITSEGRDSPVHTFSGCAFHQLDGKDLLPGTTDASPFTFYSVRHGGGGGCFDGRLGLIDTSATAEKANEVEARFVDVSADGRHATLTSETGVIATGVDMDTDSAEARHYSGISCGASAVLHPVYSAAD